MKNLLLSVTLLASMSSFANPCISKFVDMASDEEYVGVTEIKTLKLTSDTFRGCPLSIGWGNRVVRLKQVENSNSPCVFESVADAGSVTHISCKKH